MGVVAGGVVGLLGGCGVGPDRVSLLGQRVEPRPADASLASGRRLEFRPILAAYRTLGDAQGEVLATDLPIEALDPAAGLEGLSGQILRVRIFSLPIPGRTPVSNAAGNTVIQHAVIHDGSAVVYGGSGLLRPRGRLGDARLPMVLRGGTVRLTRTLGSPADPLGVARVDLWLTPRRDEALCGLIAARLDQIIERSRPIDEAGRAGQPQTP